VSGPAGQTHYEVLGISAQATPEEVERAYRFTLELYGDGALATYSLLDPADVRRARARVQEAYEVLRDPARRHAYDQGHGFASLGPGVVASNLNRRPQPPASAPAASPAPAAAPVIASTAAGTSLGEPAAEAHAPEAMGDPPGAPSEATPAAAPRLTDPSAAPAAAPVTGGAPPRPAAGAFGRTAHVLPEPITGAVLRRYREERGISLRDIANQSKIGTRYLEYIEGDRHDMLPAAVYLRGFLQEYARALGLDPRRTANSYMAQFPRPWPQE
jgi:flagellar biosynthesis protein FlhG